MSETQSESQQNSLETIDGVGPARASALVEAGYETVEDVATVDAEQLANDVYGVGDASGFAIVGSAESQFEADDEDVEEALDEVPEQNQHVLVIAGDGELESMNTGDAVRTIDEKLEQAGVNVGKIGFPEGSMGSTEIKEYITQQQLRSTDVSGRGFEVMWNEVDATDEDAMFDEAYEAAKHRNKAMTMWADEVVIVADGDYVGGVVIEAKEVGCDVHYLG